MKLSNNKDCWTITNYQLHWKHELQTIIEKFKSIYVHIARMELEYKRRVFSNFYAGFRVQVCNLALNNFYLINMCCVFIHLNCQYNLNLVLHSMNMKFLYIFFCINDKWKGADSSAWNKWGNNNNKTSSFVFNLWKIWWFSIIFFLLRAISPFWLLSECGN